MNADILFFFRDRMAALPIYQELEEKLFAQIPDVRIKVSKTQIRFSNRFGFAYVSFLPVRKAAERPAVWLTVSFGLDRGIEAPRIAAATEPYPNRWTHHVLVASAEEIDEELMEWLTKAAAFSAAKRR